MAKINFTHISGNPEDVALFLNEWDENINEVVAHECKCDKPATIKQEVECEQKPTTKRTRKNKVVAETNVSETVVAETSVSETVVAEAPTESLEVSNPKDFIENTTTEAELKEETISEAFDEVPTEDEAEEVIKADESTEPVKISFEMMKERAKSWCVEVKQQGHTNAVELIGKIFTMYGQSDTGKADRVKPELYSAVWDKLQDSATLQELVKSVSEDI